MGIERPEEGARGGSEVEQSVGRPRGEASFYPGAVALPTPTVSQGQSGPNLQTFSTCCRAGPLTNICEVAGGLTPHPVQSVPTGDQGCFSLVCLIAFVVFFFLSNFRSPAKLSGRHKVPIYPVTTHTASPVCDLCPPPEWAICCNR